MPHTSTAPNSPWHAGEVQLQKRIGVAERMAVNGSRSVRDHMPDQHRDFFGSLPFIMTGSVDETGDVWASMLTGEPGFIRSPSSRQLDITAAIDATDPAARDLQNGAAIGLLGIELHTRRRNRMNGRIANRTSAGFSVQVGQSFGNCPQYIQLRDYEILKASLVPEPVVEESTRLDEEARATVEAADTFFVASYADVDNDRQVDVSHRGGKPGFIRVDSNGRLSIPDFAGNLFFNTFGNFLVNPKAGLVFPDFETGDMLHMTGDAELDFESPEIKHFQGAERLWYFTPRRIIRRRGALALRWTLREDGFSPNALITGSWTETAARLSAEERSGEWRPYRIAQIVDETPEIRSFRLDPADDGGKPNYKAGQHLPVRVTIPGTDRPLIRTYTLSSAPSDNHLRISVKREGAVSAHLHSLSEGDLIEARGPQGAFHIAGDEQRPAVLIAAGVGITPILSMLRQIVFEGIRTRTFRPTWVVQSARDRASRPFHREIEQLVRTANGAIRFFVAHSGPGADEKPGEDFSQNTRFDVGHLSRFLPFGDYDFYLCGPGTFMQDVYDGLRGLNVQDHRIHAEAFGPSMLERHADATTGTAARVAVASDSVPVLFSGSGKEARWEPGPSTLLDLAEARGIDAPFSCRSGSCGMCATRLIKGKVAYPKDPSFEVAEGEVLVCSAVPHEDSGAIELDL